MDNRLVRVAEKDTSRVVAHLLVAEHRARGTVTTLCYDVAPPVEDTALATRPLCEHCEGVYAEMEKTLIERPERSD